MTVPDRPTGADYANDAALGNRVAITALERRLAALEHVVGVQFRAPAQAQAGLEEQVAKRLWEMDGYTHWELAEQQAWPYRHKAREILALVASYQDNGTTEVADEPA